MLKWKSAHPLRWLVTAACLFGIVYYSHADPESSDKTHACVYTPVSPEGGTVDCKNSGSSCGTVTNCIKTN